MERVGLLSERYELIDGEILSNVGQNPPHAVSVIRAILWLAGVFGGDYVLTQTTLEVSEVDRAANRPEPDVIVVRRPSDEYAVAPAGAEARLVIEVADTTLRTDLTTKAALYARAGVPEYWVLDVTSRRLIIHRQPANGTYTEVFPRTETESVAPEAAPERPVTVSDLLPRQQA